MSDYSGNEVTYLRAELTTLRQQLAAARALLREAVDDPTCAFGDPWRSNARAAGGEK